MKERFPPTFENASQGVAASCRRISLVTLLCFALADVRAHGDLDLQIQVVSAELATRPTAALFLKRGVLHHEHEDFSRALADFDQAVHLDPTLNAIWFARGRTCFKAGKLPEAKQALDVFLARIPTHAEALLLRARVLAGLHQFPAAIRDFDENLKRAPDPLPECFLERAQAIAAAGDKSAAVARLDEGMKRLGELITLQHAAIALELELNRYDAALARVDRILSHLDRKESWLARRGDILETAGRATEAAEAYRQALAAINRLPAHHRDAKSTRDLQSRLQLKLTSNAANVGTIQSRT